ncbi:MAG TPA: hypothetical protein VHO06_18770 [Polyangia bacterium]|nr:hypothetical protein [Polyangia bacterium]
MGPRPVGCSRWGSDESRALGPGGFYTANGFAFFIPHRRGQGQSSAAGAYIVDRQPSRAAIVLRGASAGRKVVALHEEANHDVEAALAWLKARPDVDPGRIVMSGVSFGGIQTAAGGRKGAGRPRLRPPSPPPP